MLVYFSYSTTGIFLDCFNDACFSVTFPLDDTERLRVCSGGIAAERGGRKGGLDPSVNRDPNEEVEGISQMVPRGRTDKTRERKPENRQEQVGKRFVRCGR